jgi:signal transduction histidine kinase
LRRAVDDRVIGGVAAGVANRTGIDRGVIRAAFVLSTLTGGVGITAYVLAWLFLPLEGEEASAASRAVADRQGIALALALVPVLVLTLVFASVVGAPWLTTIAWPLFIAAGGLVLVVRNISAPERAVLERGLGTLAPGRLVERHVWRSLVARVVTGAGVAGLGVELLTHDRRVNGLLRPLAGLGLVVVAVLLVFGPWWLQIARDLVEERQARTRAEERADLAARVHDSVLQTLALIQRRATDPHEVVTLARAQERELRSWLFEGRPPGQPFAEDATLSAAVQRIQDDVETTHAVTVEVVVVGDCPLDDDLRSLVEAGREATRNAARWSGADVVSLFAEVEAGSVTMYVRDRGRGFTESAVAADRRGISESIRGRMSRHGGTAVVKSAPGEGTEVILTMARR